MSESERPHFVVVVWGGGGTNAIEKSAEVTSRLGCTEPGEGLNQLVIVVLGGPARKEKNRLKDA